VTIKIAVVKETAELEKRVAATPEIVKKYLAKGCTVSVEAGAGEAASYPDKDYEMAGARIVRTAADATRDADIILSVQAPTNIAAAKGANLIGLFNPYSRKGDLPYYASSGLTTMAMEMVPRITRAQAMDVLSSQSNLAGYKAVLDAAAYFARAFPMMMTAAGTVAPARVFIMGAGVAGLQAIATAKRLGAVVSATDVRSVAKEQVQSLGGTFIMVESEESKNAETAGGYAKEMSDEFKAKQAKLVADHITRQDIVITTALIPGRPAPVLVTEEMVRSMKPGSIVVDLAVEQGGNCPLSKPGEVVEVGGVKILGFKNVPSRLATDASALYSRNLFNLVSLLINKEGNLSINMDDEIIKAIILTKDGQVTHPNFQ
jgi:NAD(P) transhydrogenase subunit alpha